MNLEDQVTNLELSKKLKELYIKQNSYFYWFKRKDYDPIYISIGMPSFTFESFDGINHLSPIWENSSWEYYSAFTVAELINILPSTIVTDYKTNYFYLIINKYQDDYLVEYSNHEKVYLVSCCRDEKLENALAKILIYLIENGLIKNELD